MVNMIYLLTVAKTGLGLTSNASLLMHQGCAGVVMGGSSNALLIAGLGLSVFFGFASILLFFTQRVTHHSDSFD